MSILILAEHNNEDVKSSTLSTIGAASKISSDIEVLVVGSDTEGVCKEISNYQNVKKVLSLNNTEYEHAIAEKIEPVIMSIADNYSHIFAPATTFGKNVMPRVAVKLDVAQISDVISVESEDTFIRPIYAGNALATIKSNDSKKVITIRPTSFDIVAKEGEPIIASASGVVVFSAWTYEFGNLIILYHGDDYFTHYGHNKQNLKQTLDTIERGEVIGLVGNTGVSSGPHLHFEVWREFEAVDPLIYFPEYRSKDLTSFNE